MRILRSLLLSTESIFYLIGEDSESNEDDSDEDDTDEDDSDKDDSSEDNSSEDDSSESGQNSDLSDLDFGLPKKQDKSDEKGRQNILAVIF